MYAQKWYATQRLVVAACALNACSVLDVGQLVLVAGTAMLCIVRQIDAYHATRHTA
jgi:hypothetical protein